MDRLQTILTALNDLTRDEQSQVYQVLHNRLKGHIELKYVKHGDTTYGPYKHRRVWIDGKLTDRYLGKATQAEIDAWKAQHDA